MKYSLIVILYVIITICIQAQDSTFNYLYSSEHRLPEFYHCIVHEDTIVGVDSGYYPLGEDEL